jgi:glycyl-tRNA synthetase beta subunit
MLLSLKRMNNIYTAFRQKSRDYALKFDKTLLVEEAEKNLFSFFDSKKAQIEQYIKENSYIELFDLLIGGKPIIDTFFDTVMVMAEDVKIRDNRLALLELILVPFKRLLDFSKISE